MQPPHRFMIYSPPRIPPELSDRIIDYLHDDARTLSACSLTCRDWLPRARYNRFKKLEVDAISCQGLLRLLSRTPDIGAFVRDLAICYRTFNRVGRSRRTTWDVQTLAALLCKLPYVARLELDTIDVHDCVAHVLQDYLPNLQALILTRVHVQNMTVLYELFLSFPGLQELQILDVFLMHVNTNHALDLSRKDRSIPALQALKSLRFESRIIGDIIAPTLINWLMSHGLQLSIDTFQIPDVRRNEIPVVQTLLRSLGPTLRHLCIGFADPDRGIPLGA